ncbi:MAG: CBS domain-containing protein [Hyphomonadaceae bacterium]
MTLEQILKAKGHEVTTIRANVTLQGAAQLLDNSKIGSVVATQDNGDLVGVLSERDITRQVARHGAAALEMIVSDAMTRDVITATPGETLDQGLARMTDRRIRHLPVCEDGKLVGLVSIGDLVKWKIRETEAEAEAMKNYIATG